MNSILPAIMQSIKPQYCELIAAGKKTIEVRKTKPNISTPFKVYIYCTKDKIPFLLPTYSKGNFTDSDIWKNGNGKVIGEYICDEIYTYPYLPFPGSTSSGYVIPYFHLVQTALTYDEIILYGYGKKEIYGWHISDLKIYDEPRELSEFYHDCGDNSNCKGCPFLYVESNEDVGTYEECQSKEEGWKPLTRPPQSWCYVEEV